MIFPTSKNKNDFGLSIFVFVYTDELSVSQRDRNFDIYGVSIL